jgi:ribonuclease P protein component
VGPSFVRFVVESREQRSVDPPGGSPPRRRLTLKRVRRLRKRPEFVRVQDGGSRVSTRHFLLLLMARLEPGPSRFGIVASKKVGGAVQRNRAKRLVREAMRRHLEILPDAPPGPIDLVVIVRPGADRLALADVERELAGAAKAILKRASQARP